MENNKIGTGYSGGERNLQIIEEMLMHAKSEARESGFFFILWGWLVFVASLATFTMAEMQLGQYSGWVWTILMPLGGIVSIIASRRMTQEQKAKTWLDDAQFYLWTGYGVALALVLIYMSVAKINLLPVVLCIYGIGLYISGGLIKFKPLIIGGIVCWVCSVVCWYVPDVYHFLLLASALLIGYIIPGHMLQRQNKQSHVH